MSTPTVPARPTRSNGVLAPSTDDMPQVPPRPARKLDPSPIRDVRSPLNVLPNAIGSIPPKPSNLSTEDVPPRPPSVATLPSLGQEGSEYATYDQLPAEAQGVNNADNAELGSPTQTSNVSAEMPLHAPKASLPQSTAKSMIQTVTGTDSTQAAAAGIGRAKPADDVHKAPADSITSLDRIETQPDDLKRVSSAGPSTLKPKTSFSRPTSGGAHGSRPASIYEDSHEHGIPHIGQFTPLNPNAGDVQAPSPGPVQSQHAPGIGFYNDGSARAHQRKRSGRHEFGPPGSYGLHSHNADPHDRFEKEWYEKNRERAAIEEKNYYGRPRPETALSSAELNRIVTQSSDSNGASPGLLSAPSEEIGYSASDAYVARVSPKVSPTFTRDRKKRPSSGSQPATESPLRRTSYPFPKSQQAVEDDDVDVIHIDAPEYKTSRVTGGGPADGSIDLGPQSGNTAEEGGWYVERGPGTPALASDEVLKRQESYNMQAAVTPEYHGYDSYDEYAQQDNSRRSSFRAPSRPSSRPGSVHGDYLGGNLHRFISHEDFHHSNAHTPLEEIEEYEPLIPEDEESSPKPKPKAKDIKRRPGVEHHHWPSRDIWEDTPSSMYYETTVQTPDIPGEEQTSAKSPTMSKNIEATASKGSSEQAARDIPSAAKPIAKPHYASRVVDIKPGMQRFPSKDIWEDTPTSLQFHTTVGGPQMDDSRSPPDDRPTTSAIPGSQDDDQARATTSFAPSMQPSIPARPQRRSKLAQEVTTEDAAGRQDGSRALSDEKPASPEKAKAPPMPDRPKPTVPVRPARTSRSEQTNGTGAELSKSISAEEKPVDTAAAAPPVPKTKPIVPARPGGEKIASLKAGFMSDLNNRLKLGPQGPAPKSRDIEPELVEETAKAPLSDARKGRAKGPARRKPAASPSAAAVEEKVATFSISTPITVWSIDENEKLQVPVTDVAPAAADIPALEKEMSENAAANTEASALANDSVQLEKVLSDSALASTEPLIPEEELPKLEKVLSDNAVANTEEHMGVQSLEPEKPFSPPPPLEAVRRMSIEEQKEVQARMVASLAEVGAAPAPGSEVSKDIGVLDSSVDGNAVPTASVDLDGEKEMVGLERMTSDDAPVEEQIQGVAAS